VDIRVAVAVTIVAAAAVIATVLFRADRHARPASTGAAGRPAHTTAEAAGMRLSFPPGWRRADRAPELPGITPARPIALEKPTAGLTVVAASLAATSASLLPDAFVAALDRPPPRPDRVRLAHGLEAYAGLARPGVASYVDVYVAPSTAGVATVACLARNVGALLDQCWTVVSSMSLTRGEPIALGRTAAFRVRLTAEIDRLNRADALARRALDRASTPAARTRPLLQLQPAYRRAARELAGLAPPGARRASEIVATIGGLAPRYGAVARALQRDDRPSFATARAGARRLRSHLNRLLARVLPPRP
jgi:hypothetical protein